MAVPQEPDDLEESNPYAPPQSAFVRPTSGAVGDAVPFRAGDIMEVSFTIFKERAGPVISVVVGTIALSFAINYALGIVLAVMYGNVRERFTVTVASVALQFAGWVASFWLTIGQTSALLKIGRGQRVVQEDLVGGGPVLLTVILGWVLLACAMFVPIFALVLGATASVALLRADQIGAGVALFLGSIGLCAPLVLYINARLGMYYYLAVDRDVGVIDSLGWSWRLTRGRTGTIIGVYILCGMINLAGALACLIGLILTVPLTMLMLAVTYLSLLGPDRGGAAPAMETWEADST
jgi:hypothetical protein